MRVLLGVTGSIAAFKGLLLARALVKRGHEVQTVLTQSALAFVTPLSFENLTAGAVWTPRDFFGPQRVPVHVDLARWADLVVVAPATAHLLAKLALGIADDLLSAVLLSARGPILVAPAMHSEMWEATQTQENVRRLEALGVEVLGPVRGPLSTGEEGTGRMLEPEEILERVEAVGRTRRILEGKTVVIALGRTEEPLDTVRVLTNRSSGRMGMALVRRARQLGARVIPIAGEMAVPPPPDALRVRTAEEMKEALLRVAPEADVLIMVAAVADYRPVQRTPGKIRRGERLRVELEPTEDLLKAAAAVRKPGSVFVGFALEEREGLRAKAEEKLREKGVDLMVANPLEAMGAEQTEGWILDRKGNAIPFGPIPKAQLAILLFDELARFLETS